VPQAAELVLVDDGGHAALAVSCSDGMMLMPDVPIEPSITVHGHVRCTCQGPSTLLL
jgi:hypothetical protein